MKSSKDVEGDNEGSVVLDGDVEAAAVDEELLDHVAPLRLVLVPSHEWETILSDRCPEATGLKMSFLNQCSLSSYKRASLQRGFLITGLPYNGATLKWDCLQRSMGLP